MSLDDTDTEKSVVSQVLSLNLYVSRAKLQWVFA